MKYSSLEMLEKLVSFDSVSRNSNLPLIDFIQDYLLSFGVKSELVYNEEKTKANLFANVGPNEAGGVILSGHTDVVPVDGQNWATDPFKITEKHSRLYGRGTCDMKGFNAICLSLVPEMIKAGLKKPIQLMWTREQEIQNSYPMQMNKNRMVSCSSVTSTENVKGATHDGFKSSPSSSLVSLTRACVRFSPFSTFPPGNSQKPLN